MLPEVLPAMLSLHKLRHRERDVLGLFFPYSARSVQAIVKHAANQAGLTRRVTPHTLRHCFATHLLAHGTDVRFIQELPGHKDLKTTMIYTHVTNQSWSTIQSPLDQLKPFDRFSKKPQE